MTRMDRAVDRLIAQENAAFLANPAAIAEAQAEGDLYRQRLEAGILPTEGDYQGPGSGGFEAHWDAGDVI
jgi:hypothetical protein